MTYLEDGMMLFMIYQYSKILLSIGEYGYYYNRISDDSTINNLLDKSKINHTIKDIFLYLKFLFKYTKNSFEGKAIAAFSYISRYQKRKKAYNKMTKGFDFCYKVTNLYLNCKFIDSKDKIEIKKILKKIKTREKQIIKSSDLLRIIENN